MVPASAVYGGITGLLQQPVPAFRCPSSTELGPTNQYFRVVGTAATSITAGNGTPSAGNGQDYATSNYLLNEMVAGFGPFPATGYRGPTFSDILDGTSNTFLLAERALNIAGIEGTNGNPVLKGKKRYIGAPLYGFRMGGTYSNTPGAVIFHTCYPINMPTNISDKPAAQVDYSPGKSTVLGRNVFNVASMHPGGAQFSMCDGSVRFIRETISCNPNACPGNSNNGGNLGSGPGPGMVFQNLYAAKDGYAIGAGDY
jgi:prepilin-type processing-associated H-X9-DG protein